MPETETLLPYIKKPRGEGKPTIVVDSREANTAPEIVKGLRKLDIKIRVESLDKGDYIISDLCAIERKTIHDFAYTLTRRNLFEQMFKLKEVYEKPFILIEGYLPDIYRFSKIQPASVWGAMFALAKQGIIMIYTTNYKETIGFLYTAARQEQIVENRVPAVHPAKKLETLAKAQIFFMASLPNIGREKAITLLKSYSIPINALINVDQWPKEVHGLGPKITEKVKRVLHMPYERDS